MLTAVVIQRYLAYGCASLIGLSLAFWTFPIDIMLAKHSQDLAVSGDVAQHIIGQRYFINDSWHWPLLKTTLLNSPSGLNIAFTDSIPLLALPAKLLSAYLPRNFHAIYLWLGIAYVMQPLAAVYALRSAGERRLLPAIVIAVIAISMPAFLHRVGHAALSGHFLILLAIGVYFQIRSGRTRAVFGYASGLLITSLLVHPYLMTMVAVVLMAAPISLRVNEEPAWRHVASGLLAALAATGLAAIILGYGETVPLPGFGIFSMNLLSPFYPSNSALLPDLGRYPNATGGQYEGFNFLGIGVLLLMICGGLIHAARRQVPTFLRVHAGLVGVCLGLTLLAISNRAYVGQFELYDFRYVPSFIEQFRASGRFFWPVGYVIVVSVVLMTARLRYYALGATALVAAAGLQFADARLFREADRNIMHARHAWTINTDQIRPLLASHEQLNIFPILDCTSDDAVPEVMQLLMLASEYGIPINTMHISRMTGAPSCNYRNTLPLRDGELRILLRPNLAAALDDGRDCRMLNQIMAVCSRNSRLLAGFPQVPQVTMPVARKIDTRAGGRQDLMTVGWSTPETARTWTEGKFAILQGNLEEHLQHGSELLVWCRSLAVSRGGQQQVTVFANDQQIGVWSVPEDHEVVQHAILPTDLSIGQKLTIRFEIKQPVRPIDRKIGSDERQLGIQVTAFELRPSPTMALVRSER